MATKAEPEATAMADTSAEAPGDPPNLLNPPNPLATVASCEELSVLKCTNKEDPIAHEKHLKCLTDIAINHFQKGLDTGTKDEVLKDVILELIHDIKEAVAKMYEPMRKANRKEVWKSIEDPEAEYIWNPQDDDDAQDEPTQATVQEEEPIHPVAEEFMEALDKPLMMTKLLWSPTCSGAMHAC